MKGGPGKRGRKKKFESRVCKVLAECPGGDEGRQRRLGREKCGL